MLLVTLCLYFLPTPAAAQILLPEPITNNAVAVTRVGKSTIAYSFYGLGAGKEWSDVHAKAFAVNITNGTARRIADVPDSPGRLAASASTIRNRIYITGGYAVLASGKELSSSHLFIFDPQTETYTQGASLPHAIDDHVQAVWRDSLLYVVSGWCDSLTVARVQVYVPSENRWHDATPVPNERDAKVFGGSGVIVRDTIFYLGGAVFEKSYPPARTLYKGVINAANPSEISWTALATFPGEYRYRSTAFVSGERIVFWGGSNETYNYNGIAYANKMPVEPNRTALVFDLRTQSFGTAAIPPRKRVMDIRNIVRISDKPQRSQWAIVGGMQHGQKVSRNVVIIEGSDIRP